MSDARNPSVPSGDGPEETRGGAPEGSESSPARELPALDAPAAQAVTAPEIPRPLDPGPSRPAQPAAARDRKWYIVHTYSGFEERVKETLRQRAEALDMGDAFGEIRIPTETVVEYKGGKKRETQRKFFPGYILVEMEMSDAAWHVVKNTPKVTGFVGTGRKPTPLSQDEVDKILEQVVTAKEKPKPKYVFEKAEPVRITDGPFNNFTGVVDDVNLDRNTLKVMVTIFGRQTPVELDFSQVQKI
jgi:transcription termination/antitermination protein NusG